MVSKYQMAWNNVNLEYKFDEVPNFKLGNKV